MSLSCRSQRLEVWGGERAPRTVWSNKAARTRKYFTPSPHRPPPRPPSPGPDSRSRYSSIHGGRDRRRVRVTCPPTAPAWPACRRGTAGEGKPDDQIPPRPHPRGNFARPGESDSVGPALLPWRPRLTKLSSPAPAHPSYPVESRHQPILLPSLPLSILLSIHNPPPSHTIAALTH